MVAVAIVAVYLSQWTFLLLAVLVHTIFPIWWDWPPLRKGPVRPYRPARIAGIITFGLVIAAYAWLAVSYFVVFLWWAARPTGNHELDATQDWPSRAQRFPGEIEWLRLVEARPDSYFALPQEWQLALAPCVVAAMAAGVWVWLACRENLRARRSRILKSMVASLGLATASTLGIASASTGQNLDNFTDHIAPLLESHCLRCHNDQAHKGGLSLATRMAVLKGGEGGPVIEPGKPDESVLIDAVSGAKPMMPKQGDPLKAEEVAALRTWIEQGAPWPEGLTLAEKKADAAPWWAIQPLNLPTLPVAKDRHWPRTPIDLFILARLDEKGLTPRPEADRRTLIRRVSFGLTGLPPTPEEVEAFIADTRPDAYERLVDRLLASPAYGERWARRWLDIVHYADTHGYDKDKRRDNAWPYRDYVIRAFNEDKPYDRFVREQIAGDSLWPSDTDAVIATGFISAGPWDFVGHVELAEGTVEKVKTRVLDRDDMVANTMSTFNSLTVHCARCHDHKFDPIPQRDYYQLQAVFAGVDRGERDMESAEVTERRTRLASQEKETREELRQIEEQIASVRDPRLDELAREATDIQRSIDQIRKLDEQSSPSNGYHSAIHSTPDALAWVQVDLGMTREIQSITLYPARPTDFPDTPGFGFPRKFRIEVSDDSEFRSAQKVIDVSVPDWARVFDLPFRYDGKKARGRYVRVTATRLWKRTGDYVFALSELSVSADDQWASQDAPVTALDSIEGGRWSTKFLADDYTSRSKVGLEFANVKVEKLLCHYEIQAYAIEFQRRKLVEGLLDLTRVERQNELESRLREIEKERATLHTPRLVYGIKSHEPREVAILKRGEVEQPGETVGPGAIACVPGLKAEFDGATTDAERRMALARWLTDAQNVLTWRSMANRVWQFHFGKGLVDTPNDFGRNGSTPSHPELLDWLAVELLENGRSLKALQRQIVLSATYRQSSEHDEQAATIDADNRYLWRQNRRRLEAEELRDAVLAAAGTLDRRMGGPGFEVFRYKDDHSPIYDHEDKAAIIAPGSDRRAIYRFVVRSVPNPWIECLDGADANANVPARNVTITPLQSLALLNDPFMIEQARQFSERLQQSDTTASVRIDQALRIALGRPATADECGALASFAQKHGLAAACRLIFNLNEFMFID